MDTRISLLIGAAVGLEVLAQVSFKVGASCIAKRLGDSSAGRYLRALLGNPWIHAGMLAYAVEFPVAVAALTLAPLSVVFPLLGLSYAGAAAAGRVFLGESLCLRNQAGIVLVTLGAAMVSWSPGG